MHPLPHRYRVTSASGPEGDVVLCGKDVENLRSQAPVEFGGPGHRWSPESLLVGAVADCFVLTFRSIARSGGLSWQTLTCHVDGVLERTAEGLRFTGFTLDAQLRVPAGTDPEAAQRALHRAEQGCLISNSLRGQRTLVARVEVLA